MTSWHWNTRTWGAQSSLSFHHHPSLWVFSLLFLIDIPGTQNCNDMTKKAFLRHPRLKLYEYFISQWGDKSSSLLACRNLSLHWILFLFTFIIAKLCVSLWDPHIVPSEVTEETCVWLDNDLGLMMIHYWCDAIMQFRVCPGRRCRAEASRTVAYWPTICAENRFCVPETC